jgi:hypothetical protein
MDYFTKIKMISLKNVKTPLRVYTYARVPWGSPTIFNIHLCRSTTSLPGVPQRIRIHYRFLNPQKKTPKGLYSVLWLVYSRSLAKKKDEGDIKKEAVEI